VKKIVSLSIGFFILIVALVFGLYIATRPNAFIPNSIKSQLHFAVFVPMTDNNGISLVKKSVTYITSNEILKYDLVINNVKVTITEQQYPGILIYDHLVGAMNQYAELNSPNGTVALTQPSKNQIGVLTTGSTLIFANAINNLTNEQWQTIFNAFKVQ